MKAEKDKIVRSLKTARGQLDGLLKMVEDDRYCIDISTQLMATQALLRKVNREVLHAHLQSCVKSIAVQEEDHRKIEEVIMIMDKLSK